MSSKSSKLKPIEKGSDQGQLKEADVGGKDSAVAVTVVETSHEGIRDHPGRCSEVSSIKEISIIENMTSFLEAHGAIDLDEEVLRNMAETLTKRINDTSPGTLQDVTMENSYGVGYRSPCVSLQQYQGSTSPAGHGRSVREFEEQMATLRKENFNLKLRLYFMEESIPGYHQQSGDGQETLSKQLIEAKVEMEMLRKEIQEKQEILKEAAQAMNQMEKIQKDTETKSQAIVDELKQKIQYMEMEREMEKSSSGGDFMNNILGISNISDVNALQRIRELEGVAKHSEDKINEFQDQMVHLDNLVSKRDETIKEYEEKVKELVFQNAELLESLESKEKEMANAERVLRGLRLSNADLKEDNHNLNEALKKSQDNFRNEMSNVIVYEHQMREQQDALSKMQSTLAVKTQNTARLLERIQDYEKMVTKMNFERNLVKRENRFFKAIIGKLQSNKTECYTIEKEFYQHIVPECTPKLLDGERQYDLGFEDSKGRGDYQHREYKLKHKFCVNYCNHANFSNSSLSSDGGSGSGGNGGISSICGNACVGTSCLSNDYLNGYCDIRSDLEAELPIRYTISDASLYDVGETSKSSSLHANISSSSVLAGSRELVSKDIFLQSQRLREELQAHKSELADKTCMLQEAEEKLQDRIKIHEQACRTVQKLMLNIKNQQDEIHRLKNQKPSANASQASNSSTKEQANGSSGAQPDFECTGLCRSMSDTEALSEFASGHRQKLEAIIKQQDSTIETLKREIKKKTANLQSLVNKELWEKNREIERLTKLINKNPKTPLSPPAADGHGELQQSFSDVEYARALEHNKLLQRKVDILIQRLGVDRQNESLLAQLRSDLREARSDAEKAEKWRHECADVCTVLSNRLEELAGFLNSLLKHKDVLGVLAVDKRRAMRKAVDRSLDLSKSLNHTLSISGISIVDQSLAQLSNLSEILGEYEGSVLDKQKTFNSHEELFASHPSIETLQAENNALKKELDRRRVGSVGEVKKDRRSLPLPNLEHSESEAWSEPDRKVSLARIGLEDHTNTKLLPKEVLVPQREQETDSESEAAANAAASGSVSLQQSQSKTQNGSSKTRTHERVAQLEQLIAQRDDRILDISTKLVEADNRLKKESLRVLDMTAEIKQLRQRNEELHQDLITIGGAGSAVQTQEIANHTLLLRQLDERSRSLERVQEERDRVVVEARLAEMKIGALKADMAELDHRQQLALSTAAEQEHFKLQQLREEMDTLLQQRLDAQQRLHEQTVAREFVTRNLHEETVHQLLELQRQYTEAQRNINCLQENEQEMKQTLVDSELGARALQKQLDESTLQASKAVLERTKALNDKMQLEQCMQELNQQLSAQHAARQQLQRQLSELEKRLQLTNKAQQPVQQLNTSDVSQSGYTSEEVLAAAGGESGAKAKCKAVASGERHNNSSPDLGIESDAGRVSSVELTHAQCAQLKTVELPCSKVKEELSDGANEENLKPLSQQQHETANANANATSNHDCAKVELENAELRRKLIRTKRAFEDTYEKLRVANQRKAQIEKDIKNQILKTHNVLKNVRSNMENEL